MKLIIILISVSAIVFCLGLFPFSADSANSGSIIEIFYEWVPSNNAQSNLLLESCHDAFGNKWGSYYYNELQYYKKYQGIINKLYESTIQATDLLNNNPSRLINSFSDYSGINTEISSFKPANYVDGKAVLTEPFQVSDYPAAQVIYYQNTPEGIIKVCESRLTNTGQVFLSDEYFNYVKEEELFFNRPIKPIPNFVYAVESAKGIGSNLLILGGGAAVALLVADQKIERGPPLPPPPPPPPPPNQAPIVSFTVTPTAGNLDTVFYLDASGTYDPEDQANNLPLQYRWDWESDGIWDIDWSDTITPTHQYTTSGDKGIKLEVRDSEELVGSKVITVSIGVQLGVTQWPKFHRDLKNTGYVSTPGTTISSTKWSFVSANDIIESSPSIGADGTIYIGCNDRRLYAISPNSGVKRWHFDTGQLPNGNAIHSSPAIDADGTIYFGCNNNKLYAIRDNGTSASLKWSFPTSGTVQSSPTIGSDGIIYVGSDDNNLYAVTQSGGLKWKFSTGGDVRASPTIADDGTIYITSYDGRLYAINPDGSLKWAYSTPSSGWISSSPVIGPNGTIYFGGGNDATFYAVNPNGTLKWTYNAVYNITSTPAVSPAGVIYVGLNSPPNTPIASMIALSDTGTSAEPVWEFATNYGVRSSPVVAGNGRVYFTSDDGKVWCKIEGGSFWSYSVGAPTGTDYNSSPAIASNGVIYVGTPVVTKAVVAIGVDPATINLTKQVNKTKLTIGDVVTYKVTFTNTDVDPTDARTYIEDQIPYGFKYVKGSTLLDGVKTADPEGNAILKFSVSTVTANGGTKILSYQLVVGSGVTFGKYENKAICYYYDGAPTILKASNVARAEVLVIPDPLFDLGTIIGKVFEDKNGNGVQDYGEAGIPDSEIIMEDGTIIRTDKDGKYHVPGVTPGMHLLQFKSSGVQEFKSSQLVRVTEGLLCKANFAVVNSASGVEAPLLENQNALTGTQNPQSITQPSSTNELTIVAMGDGVLGTNQTSGNTAPVKHKDEFDKGFYGKGRLAGYLKAKINDEYLITSSLDTDRTKNRDLYRFIDPDKYYLNYGDDSNISYDATNTQGPVYLSVEHLLTKSSFLLGNYNTGLNETELFNYNRTMYGVKLNLMGLPDKSPEGTLLYPGKVKETGKFILFGSPSYNIAAHNEIRATGGSFYYLKHKNLINGSEKIKIETRDKVTNMVLSSKTVERGNDYQIDYSSGRIIFTLPVGSVSESSSIISTNILNGNPVYIVTDYEYEPDILDFRAGTYGGRISYPVVEGITVGASYVTEDNEDKNYAIKGMDTVIRLPYDVKFSAEFADSVSRAIPNYFSLDGGLSFGESFGLAADKGNAYTFKLENPLLLDMDPDKADPVGYKMKMSSYYQFIESGFISSGSFTQQGTKKYGTMISHQLIKNELSLNLRYDAQEMLEDSSNLLSSYLVGGHKTETTALQGNYNKEKLSLTGEVRYQRVIDDLPITTETNRDTSIGAIRAGYQVTPKLNVFVGQQGTMKGPANYQTTAGLTAQVKQNMSTTLQGTSGTDGNSFLAGLNTQVSDKTQVYNNIGYNVNTSDNDTKRSTTTASGVSSQITPQTKIYAQEQYQTSNEAVANSTAMGQETQLDKKWRLGCAVERGVINGFDGNDTIRQAGSVNAWFNNEKELRFNTKLETRQDIGPINRKQYGTANSMNYQLTPDWSLIGRFNWSETMNETSDSIEALFNETGLGLALRPIKWDRLNLIGKYTYLIDNHPLSKMINPAQLDPMDTTKEKANVYAAEGAYDFPSFQLVEKYAFKNGQEKVGMREYTDSDTSLWITRINYHLLKKIDAGVEYRILKQSLADDQRAGYLVEGLYKISEYAYFGVGYNFTDFTDDLIHDNDYSVKGPFIRFVGTFSK